MLIGYARVSTEDQNLDLQLDALHQAGCKRCFTDKQSGTHVDRPGLKDAFSHLREGDSLVIWKLDRFGRSVKDLMQLVGELEQQKINFRSLTDNIDTSTPSGRFFFHVMASLSQMEKELLLERTRAGLAAAKKQGRIGGRKRSMTATKMASAQKLFEQGVPPKDIAKSLGVSIPTLYRWFPASAFVSFQPTMDGTSRRLKTSIN